MENLIALSSDEAILEEFQRGNSDHAATAFVRKYQNFVYFTALRHLKEREDAEDAAQEVFIRVLKNIHKFRGDSSISTWLYRITVNVCSGMRRKEKLRTFFDLEPILPFIRSKEYTPEQRAESADFEERFQRLLEELPDKQRETFVLRYFEELSYEEISRMLGTSVGGLKANYFQAVKKLSGKLQASERYE